MNKFIFEDLKLLGEDYILLDKRKKILEKLKEEVESCRKCDLYKTRIKTVFGVGNINSKIMFIGEAPGYEEDKKGEPFVGKAGSLLDELLESIGLNRSMVYITNVVKCHPVIDPDPYKKGNDRPPNDFEISMCSSYLLKQIEVIKPSLIVLLGATSAYALLGIKSISKIRGNTIKRFIGNKEYLFIPTYHPAAVLRNPKLMDEVKKDFEKIKLLV
ncbi:MAG: uracil-DNA glycosylase [bacterium]|nr:uracil-DNA glycosylase [bacterium]